MKKGQLQYYSALFVCAISIFGSIGIFIKDGNVSLSEQNVVTGKVVDSGIIYHTSGGRHKTTRRYYYARLDNSIYKFAVYRDYQGYDDLEDEIKTGDELTIYYRDTRDDVNRDVFQIEKGQEILYHVQDYKDRSSTLAALLFMLGIALTIYVVCTHHKINLAKLLLDVVR